MKNICDVLGITVNDLTEFFGCFSAITMASIFMGHFLFYGFYGMIVLIGDVARAAYKLVVRHFPNVRKRKENKCHDKR